MSTEAREGITPSCAFLFVRLTHAGDGTCPLPRSAPHESILSGYPGGGAGWRRLQPKKSHLCKPSHRESRNRVNFVTADERSA